MYITIRGLKKRGKVPRMFRLKEGSIVSFQPVQTTGVFTGYISQADER